MKKLVLLAGVIASFSFSSVAAPKAFTAADENFETKACVVAASEGMDAVKALVSEKGLVFRNFKQSVTCNNKSLNTFAKMYHGKASSNDAPVVVVAKNNNFESRVCVSAVNNGIKHTLAKFRINQNEILCNGKPLNKFVKASKTGQLAKLSSED
ncbi:hypothetical protein PN836_017820 [Ningiella sp. W23]|uniref:hypothetical protein n=1 Tax=Ningiella sp. W23 TaxID=3023715 RepID=UPI003756E788